MDDKPSVPCSHKWLVHRGRVKEDHFYQMERSDGNLYPRCINVLHRRAAGLLIHLINSQHVADSTQNMKNVEMSWMAESRV